MNQHPLSSLPADELNITTLAHFYPCEMCGAAVGQPCLLRRTEPGTLIHAGRRYRTARAIGTEVGRRAMAEAMGDLEAARLRANETKRAWRARRKEAKLTRI